MAATSVRGTVRVWPFAGVLYFVRTNGVSPFRIDGLLVEILEYQVANRCRSPTLRDTSNESRRSVLLGHPPYRSGTALSETGNLGLGHQPIAQSPAEIG